MSVNSLFKSNDYQIFIGNENFADADYDYALYVDSVTGKIGLRNPYAFGVASKAVPLAIPAGVTTIIGTVVVNPNNTIAINAGTGITPNLTVAPYEVQATINFTGGTAGEVVSVQFGLSASLPTNVLTTSFTVPASGAGTVVLSGETPNLTVATYAFSVVPAAGHGITVAAGSKIGLQLIL